MRTTHCQRILPDTPCLTVMEVKITFREGEIARVVTDGVPVRDLDAFALRDGFVDAVDMWAFWRDHHPETVPGCFRGVLIEWARPAETMLGVAA
jgi:hypothetical protein